MAHEDLIEGEVRTSEREVIEISIPGSVDLVVLARFTAATIGARAGFDLDEIDDLRLAVDELSVSFGPLDADTRLRYTFLREGDTVNVRCTREPSDEEGDGGAGPLRTRPHRLAAGPRAVGAAARRAGHRPWSGDRPRALGGLADQAARRGRGVREPWPRSTPTCLLPAPRRAEARRDRDIRDERVHSHLGLAHQLARRFSNRGETHDDLVQVASLALVRAAERFDPDRGVMFSTFAAASIIGELKRHFRDRGWAVRAPRRLQEMVLEIGSATDRLGQELGRAPTVPELAKEIRASEADVLEALEAGQSYRTSSLDARDREGQSMAESIGSEDSGFVGGRESFRLGQSDGHPLAPGPRDRAVAVRRWPDPVRDRRPARRQPDADQPPARRQPAPAPLQHRGAGKDIAPVTSR